MPRGDLQLELEVLGVSEPDLFQASGAAAAVLEAHLLERFGLEVEELMLERGIVVPCETVRRWCAKFGSAYAGALRRRQPRSGDKWHLDEAFIKINGRLQYL